MTSQTNMNRRRFLQFATAPFILNGCANSPLGQTMASISEITIGNRASIDPHYVNNLPYASVLVSRANKQKVLLILGKVEGQQLHWVSTEKSVLITQGGRIVQTVGLEENLVKTSFLAHEHISETQADNPTLDMPLTTHRTIDLQPGNRFGIVVQTRTKSLGKDKVTILSKEHLTTLVEEQCEARDLQWTFKNLFWLGEDGVAWKSLQHIAPKQPPITIEVTKPYLG